MMRGGKGLYVGERIAAVALWAASVWPMWRWWARRLSEPFNADAVAWCVFVAFAAMLWRRAGTAAAKELLPTWKWLWAAGFLALFHLARTALPPTASGVFAVLAGLPLAAIILMITGVGLRAAFVLLPVYMAALLAAPA